MWIGWPIIYVVFSVFLVITPLYSSPTETGMSCFGVSSLFLYLLIAVEAVLWYPCLRDVYGCCHLFHLWPLITWCSATCLSTTVFVCLSDTSHRCHPVIRCMAYLYSTCHPLSHCVCDKVEIVIAVVWLSRNVVGHNKVAVHWATLVLRWVYSIGINQAIQANSAWPSLHG